MADEFRWAVTVMRAGYSGRALTYLAVAGLSLWAIWQGGEAKGTGDALRILDGSVGGIVGLLLIGSGLLAYMVWRLVDAIWDLEAYESDATGLVARAGMVVTGLAHGALGVAALSLIVGSGGGGQNKIAYYLGRILDLQSGRWAIGLAGAATIAAGIYYLQKALRGTYRDHLKGNHFTANWNWALKAGVLAQGIIVGLIGLFLLRAGINGDPEQAGGLTKVFDFLSAQAFGQVLVVAICLGLLAFALFCAVNARYRIVPRADDTAAIQTLSAVLRQ